MSNNNLAVLRETVEFIKSLKKKDFNNRETAINESIRIAQTTYTQHLLKNLASNVPYRNIYKLNQMMNAISPFLKSTQSKGDGEFALENIFEDKNKMTLRFVSSFHYLFGELQMLIEQDYQLQAFGRLRLVLELLMILDISYSNEDVYLDGLMFGNYHWGKYEDGFGPNTTEETKSFTNHMEEKYSSKDLRGIYHGIERNTGKKFVATKEFRERYKGDDILLFAGNMSHNFNHAGAMLLALDDKPDLYDSMSLYASQIIMYAIFKVARRLFDKVKKVRTPELDNILFELKLMPLYDIINEIDNFIDEVLLSEDDFKFFIEKRRDQNK